MIVDTPSHAEPTSAGPRRRALVAKPDPPVIACIRPDGHRSRVDEVITAALPQLVRVAPTAGVVTPAWPIPGAGRSRTPSRSASAMASKGARTLTSLSK